MSEKWMGLVGAFLLGAFVAVCFALAASPWPRGDEKTRAYVVFAEPGSPSFIFSQSTHSKVQAMGKEGCALGWLAADEDPTRSMVVLAVCVGDAGTK